MDELDIVTMMDRNTKSRKFSTITFFLFCVSGLVYQSYFVTEEYFKYGVRSSTTLTQSNDYILPSLTTCFEIHEVFNYEQFNLKYNSSYIYNDSDPEAAYEAGLELQTLITPNDVLKFTPSVNDFINECEIRNSSNFRYHYYKKEDCYKHFDLKKFTISSVVCYIVTLNPINGTIKHIYNRETSYFTPCDQGELYFIFLNRTLFNHFDIITNIMHPSDKYPWEEFTLSQLRARGYDGKKKEAKDNLFGSKSSSITVRRQPPPYQTMCRNYSRTNEFQNSKHCLLKCIHNRIEDAFDRASLINHYFNGSNLKLMSNVDVDKDDFAPKYLRILNLCNDRCPPTDCVFESTFTTTQGIGYSFPGMYVMLPDRPSFVIKYTVGVLFAETVALLCSVFGFWFGFSIYGMNPIGIWECYKGNSKYSRFRTENQVINLLMRERKSDQKQMRKMKTDIAMLKYSKRTGT